MSTARVASAEHSIGVGALEAPDRTGAPRATGRVRLSEGLAYGVTAVLSTAIAVVGVPLYTYWSEPAAYGDFALVSTGAGLLSSIILAVFSNVLYRHYDRERRAGRLDTFLSTLTLAFRTPPRG